MEAVEYVELYSIVQRTHFNNTRIILYLANFIRQILINIYLQYLGAEQKSNDCCNTDSKYILLKYFPVYIFLLYHTNAITR